MAGIPEDPVAEQHELKRALGPVHLIALGIGAIIGAGIFVLTGHAAAKSFAETRAWSSRSSSRASAVSLPDFATPNTRRWSPWRTAPTPMPSRRWEGRSPGSSAGIWCSNISPPVRRSRSVGLATSTHCLAKQFGLHVPDAYAQSPIAISGGHIVATGAVANFLALSIVALVTVVLIVGVKLSAQFNAAMVALKLTIVVLVIAFGLPLVKAVNLHPFIPPNTGTWGQFGYSGVLRATGVIFFAYIGFDAVSVAAQEAKNPQRDMPIGILGSLAICTVLYILMSLVMTGLVSYTKPERPASGVHRNPGRGTGRRHALARAPSRSTSARSWASPRSSWCCCSAKSRIFYAMAKRRDLFPPLFSKIHPSFQDPLHRHHHHRHILRSACRPCSPGHPGRARLDRHARGVRGGLRRHHDPAPAAPATRKRSVPRRLLIWIVGPARHHHVRRSR